MYKTTTEKTGRIQSVCRRDENFGRAIEGRKLQNLLLQRWAPFQEKSLRASNWPLDAEAPHSAPVGTHGPTADAPLFRWGAFLAGPGTKFELENYPPTAMPTDRDAVKHFSQNTRYGQKQKWPPHQH